MSLSSYFSSYCNLIAGYSLALVFTLVSAFQIDCNAQGNFTYQPIPETYLPSDEALRMYVIKREEEMRSAYNLTHSLPEGYVRDGSVDYTAYIQQGMNAHRKVIFPNFPVLINEKGLSVADNSILLFQEKSKLRMIANNKVIYQILRIYNKENVQVFFPNLEGDRFDHKGEQGEWGMGIAIAGSSNIQIINPRISNCWGDGIYIGESSSINTNIEIFYPVLDKNRRNGISIISVNGLLLESPVVANTYGTRPSCGIDIEPNKNENEITNVVINNPVTFNNHRFGIVLSLERIKGPLPKTVSISINDHVDNGSLLGIKIMEPNRRKNVRPLSGLIEINNPIWLNNRDDTSKLYRGNRQFPKIILNEN